MELINDISYLWKLNISLSLDHYCAHCLYGQIIKFNIENSIIWFRVGLKYLPYDDAWQLEIPLARIKLNRICIAA